MKEQIKRMKKIRKVYVLFWGKKYIVGIKGMDPVMSQIVLLSVGVLLANVRLKCVHL